MNSIYRIIDVNINRASEGLRVLEDVARLHFNNRAATVRIRSLRHGIRENIMDLMNLLLSDRDSSNDIGLVVSQSSALDNKSSMTELVAGNFKRVQEALRVIEENLKIADRYAKSKLYEGYRFECYGLEKEFAPLLSVVDKRKKLDTDLYCITGEEYSRGRSNIDVVRQMIDAGIKIIQYREKDKKHLYKYEECKIIREMTAAHGVTFIINDDMDIAVLVGADGIHVGQEDLPVREARKLAGDSMIIGVSTHSPEQAQKAIADGADYIGVGPVFKTLTKKDVCEPVGLEYLNYAVKNVSIPFVAIGGIKEHNIGEIYKRGARLIALVTEITGAEDIGKKISDIRQAISNCK